MAKAGTADEEPDEPDELTIRSVTIDDLETLVDIYLDTARHHAAIDPAWFRVPDRAAAAARLRRRIAARGPDGEYVAATIGGRMVGSATIFVEEPADPGSMVRPLRVAEFGVSVVDGQRGRGVGRALIGHVQAWAAAHGVDWVILNVAEANVDAIRLYHDLGFDDYDRAMRKDLAGRRRASTTPAASPAPDPTPRAGLPPPPRPPGAVQPPASHPGGPHDHAREPRDAGDTRHDDRRRGGDDRRGADDR